MFLQSLEDFAAGDDHFLQPGARGIERHEFDEAQAQVAFAGEVGQRLDFMIVDAADDDGVDFDRREAEFLRETDGLQHFAQAVAAGHLFEIRAVERIEAEPHAVQAGGAQRPGFLGEQETVRRHGEVVDAGNVRDAGHEILDIVAQERFAAGEPDFVDAESDGEADDAFDFLEAEDARFGDPLLDDGCRVGQVRPMAAVKILRGLSFRQAIQATEIAAVRDADPQVAQNPAVRIDEQLGLDHLGTEEFVAAVLVCGGMTRTEPSAPISTFKS